MFQKQQQWPVGYSYINGNFDVDWLNNDKKCFDLLRNMGYINPDRIKKAFQNLQAGKAIGNDGTPLIVSARITTEGIVYDSNWKPILSP